MPSPYGDRLPRALYTILPESLGSKQEWETRVAADIHQGIGRSENYAYRADSSLAPGQVGLFASQRVKKGQVICSDRPWAVSQLIHNRQHVLACSGCLAFVGSLEQQLDLLSGVVSPVEAGRVPADWQLPWMPTHAKASASTAPSEHNPQSKCPTKCPCGETFCGAQCMESCGHRFLCVAQLPEASAEQAPLFRFKLHAMQSNGLYLFGARIMSKVMNSVERGQDLRAVLGPLVCMVSEPWWDFAAPVAGEKLPEGGITEYRARVKEESLESLGLLRAALLDGPGKDAAAKLDTAGLLSECFWGQLLGGLQMNDFGLAVDSPLRKYIQAVARDMVHREMSKKGDEGHDGAQRAAVQLVRHGVAILKHRNASTEGDAPVDGDRGCKRKREDIEGHDDECTDCKKQSMATSTDELKDEVNEPGLSLTDMLSEDAMYSPPLSGVGVFPFMACVNHSCSPNAKVVFRSDGDGARASLVALRSIPKDEEILHCYINRHLTRVARGRRLQEIYGFSCRCVRCNDAAAQKKTEPLPP